MPQFIGGFFFPQQMFQLAWLYRLYKLDPKKPAERTELDQIGKPFQASPLDLDKANQSIVDFVPYYSIGNLCIGSMSSNQSLLLTLC